MATYKCRARAVHTLLYTLLLLQWTSAQLTASMTSPGNHLIAMIEITNPTQNTISILAWNNAFDNTTQLPVLFSVKDDQGNDVQLASTNVMRAGMSDSDFFRLGPGQSYYRTVDLRQIIQDVPSGPSAPSGAGLAQKTITIYPPTSFKGIIGNIPLPLQATADLTGDPPSLGDFAAAKLQDITVLSKPQKYNAAFPMVATGNLDPSFTSSPDGVHVNGDCIAQNLTNDANAVFDAGVYAHSLGMAANDSSSPLFPLFFPAASRHVVSSIATAAENSISGMGPHVDVYCTDLKNLCVDSNILGYAFTPSFIGNAYIVLCPSARTLGRAPQPCYTPETGYQRSASTSHVLFHLLMTLNNVVTIVMANSVYGTAACEQLARSTLVDATNNPDSLAQLAIAHWGYGLGGAPYIGPSCLPTGDVLPDMQKRASDARPRILKMPHKPVARAAVKVQPEWHAKRQSQILEVQKTQDCSAAELDLLNIAVTNAQALAGYASDDLTNTDSASIDRWTTFFNGDSMIKAQVKATYDAVVKWNTTAPYASDVYYRCDPTRQSTFCKGVSHARIVYATTTQGALVAILIACPELFYEAITLECINPSYLPSYLESLATDMSGSILHELLHIKTVTNRQTIILDGSPPCYEWNCMTQSAHDRVLPDFPSVNLPENVASNYEYFAYSARASRSDCSWTEYAGNAYGSIVSTHMMAGAQFFAQNFGG